MRIDTTTPSVSARRSTGRRPAGALAALALFTATSFLPLHSYSQVILEEITVTARKREESLQDIPLTVNAFTKSVLEERGIASLNNIADATPGFDFAQAFGRQDFRPAIRGQSTIIGRANAGLFIDGIIIERGAATVPLSALERVEVVKGPQSALYGRSTLAGAVNYVLKKPTEDFEGEVTAEYGERDYIRAEAHVSGPITEVAGFALTLARYQRDGEYDNSYAANSLGTPAINDEVGGEETSSAVAVFTFNPVEQLNITAHAMYERTDDDQYAIALQPPSFNNCFITGARNPNRSTGADGMPLSQPAPPPGTPEAGANFVNSAPYRGSGYYCGRVDVDDVLATNNGATNLETSFYDNFGTETKSLRLGLKLEYDLTDTFTFTSVTGYNEFDNKLRQDQTFGGGDLTRPPVPFIPAGRVGFLTFERGRFDDFSQELRLAYDGEGMRHMVGSYYYTSEDTGTSINSSNARAFYSEGGMSATDDGKNEITSWSVFGAMEFDFTDTLTLGATFRYNKDRFKFFRDEMAPIPDTDVKGAFSKFLPKFTARYQPADNLTVYANMARGNKPGGLNSAEGTPAADRNYDEETAWSYELGVKSLWLDDRLRANVAVYHIDWKDQQLTVTRAARVRNQNRTFSILQNIGKSTINGVELELALDVTDFWNVYLGYALTDGKIDRFIQSVDAGATAGSAFREAALLFGYQPGGDVLITGTELPQVSRHQLNLSNTFTGDLTANFGWFLRTDFNYNSKRYAQVYNLAHTGAREIVNLRGGIRSDSFDIELWVNNVLNNDTSPALIRYVSAGFPSFLFDRAIGLTLPDERRIGITARYRF